MSMNRAAILCNCIMEKIDDEQLINWVAQLYELADPQADIIRQSENEIKSLGKEISRIKSWMSDRYPLFSSKTVWEQYCDEKNY